MTAALLLLLLGACALDPSPAGDRSGLGKAAAALDATRVTVSDPDGQSGDAFGAALSAAGDVDGDGLGDLLIGAPGHDTVADDAGLALVLTAADGLASSALLRLLAATAQDGAVLGSAVAGAGDIDGDGYADVVAGSPGADGGAGAVLVGFGPDLSRQQRVVATGAQAGDAMGASVAGGGDLDGDGHDDVVIGMPGGDDAGVGSGAVLVAHGGPDGLTEQTRLSDPAGQVSDAAGWAVTSGQDLDGDGLHDLLVGVPGDDALGPGSGAVLLALGGELAFDAEVQREDGDADDFFGWSMAAAGDLDADGYPDVVAGAHGAYQSEGVAVLLFGAAEGLSARQEAVPLWTGQGGDWFGSAIAGAGDIDHDGFDDVIVGARFHDAVATDAGAAAILWGAADGLDGTRQELLLPVDGQTDDHFGVAVAGPGDLDGDGRLELAIGADGPDFEAGAVTLVSGPAPPQQDSGTPTETDGGALPGDTGPLGLDEDTGFVAPHQGCRCSGAGPVGPVALTGLGMLLAVGFRRR